jgi:hypothetical protein
MYFPELFSLQKKLTTGRGRLRVQGLDPYKHSDLRAFRDSKPNKAPVEVTFHP